MILLIGNINMVTAGIPEAILGWPLGGSLWVLIVAIQNVVAVAAIVAALVALFRRLVIRPKRLLLTRTSLIILGFILAVVSTELFAQAFEAAAYGDIPGAFVANALAVPLSAVGTEAAATAFAVLWWAHILVLSAFLIYIPFNKHFHVYTSFVNVWLRKLEPRGVLPQMDLEREDATFGIRTLADLSRKDLLDGFTCTECGRCDRGVSRAQHREVLEPALDDHGHPADVRGRRARRRHRPELADRSPGLRAWRGHRRHRAACGAGRRWSDRLRRGVGLRDLRSMC